MLDATPMLSVRMPPRLLRRCHHCRSAAALSPVVSAAAVVGSSPLPSSPHAPSVRGEGTVLRPEAQSVEAGGRGQGREVALCLSRELATGGPPHRAAIADPRFNPDPPCSAPRQRTFPPPLRVPRNHLPSADSPPPARSRKTRADG
ncbi:unnamed protein product [Closterium sp. NIES-64]|nr:unnamed protein product [Closterium sp. NIES-64]